MNFNNYYMINKILYIFLAKEKINFSSVITYKFPLLHQHDYECIHQCYVNDPNGLGYSFFLSFDIIFYAHNF